MGEIAQTQIVNNNNNNNVYEDNVELLEAQAQVLNHLFAYAETLALRSVVELRIADIIHCHGHPISLSRITSKLESSSTTTAIPCLERVMRMLVRKKIFTIHYNNSSSNNNNDNNNVVHDEPPLYGLTPISKCLLHDQELSLAPTILSMASHTMVKPWFEIVSLVKDGSNPFEKAHGAPVWEYASKDHEFNNLFNVGMAAITKPTLDCVVKEYKEGFSKLEGTLVDVGGGIGKLVAKIVKFYPHIKGVNFDRPQVVVDAPQYPGVTHVGGDIFQEIPLADNIIIKSVLHDWADEECLKILANCQKAIQHKKGKVIIVDVILHPNRHEMLDDVAIATDLLMMTTCDGGKERTEVEWRKLLKEAGFTHINIIPFQNLMSLSIIEAFCAQIDEQN